ncbi:hypothetical protein [Epibacterium ulvae]|uniref:hypothetical protein n=1 Tax=Epibacterium ulvae TaxID=1156985 RepID=UPI0024925BF1|nr:hypothetical protein [Epibacterium ulvae]
MAYVSTIPDPWDAIEIDTFFESESAAHIAIAEVGYSSASDAVYKVMVALSPAITQPPHSLELFFYFVRASEEDDSVEEINNGLQTKHIIPSDERTRILDVVCRATQELLDIAKPPIVHYISGEPNMPEKARRKYGRICKAIRERGYDGREVDPFLGTHEWILKRTDA